MVQLEQQIIRRTHRINVSGLPFCSLSLTSTLSSLTLVYFALFSKIFIFFNSFRFFQHENSPFIINNKGLNKSKYSGPKWHIQRSRSVSRGPKVQPISRGPNMKTQGSRSKLPDIKSKIQIKVQTRLFCVCNQLRTSFPELSFCRQKSIKSDLFNENLARFAYFFSEFDENQNNSQLNTETRKISKNFDSFEKKSSFFVFMRKFHQNLWYLQKWHQKVTENRDLKKIRFGVD